jgi:hypothetical protein
VNFLRSVWFSCTSFAAYRHFCPLRTRDSLFYLAKLTAVLAAALVITFIPTALQLSQATARWADENFPPFRIEKGRVLTDVEQPFRKNDKDFLFLLDTTRQISETDFTTPLGIFFGADTLTIWSRDPDGKLLKRSAPLNGFPEGKVNGAYVAQLVKSFLWVAAPFLFAVMMLLGLMSGLLQAYLFTAISTALERAGAPSRLSFREMLNIAIHAVTPAAILTTIYIAFQLKGISFGFVYIATYGIFLLGATNACRKMESSHDGGDD